MAKLAMVKTGLGNITLHHTKQGHFVTRRKFTNRDGDPYRTEILLSETMARYWYGLAAERGVIFKPFPKGVSP